LNFLKINKILIHEVKKSITLLTVVIVTKNRAQDLKECLQSLTHQIQHPDELVIIDNNSTDNTRAVVKSFVSSVPYIVRVVLEKKQGYPAIYNRGLQEAKYSWIAFIDDDCIAGASWVASIRSAIKQHPHAAALLGLSETLHPTNPYAFVTFLLNYIWKEKGTRGKKVVAGEILDNKNIVYNRLFLTDHKLRFDETRTTRFHGASEDCDLGNNIVTAGGQCFYEKTIRVKHKDPGLFLSFVRKFIRSYRAYLNYKLEIGSQWPEETRGSSIKLRTLTPQLMDYYHLSVIQKFHAYITLIGILLIKNVLLITCARPLK
jgi:glycosyltransferase involved in cell wall biosynthesis